MVRLRHMRCLCETGVKARRQENVRQQGECGSQGKQDGEEKCLLT